MKNQVFLKIASGVLILLIISVVAHAQNKVVAYVPNWVNLGTFTNQIDYAKLTHINIAFENLYNDNGDLSFSTSNNQLITKAHQNNIKVCVSIGGGSASSDQTLTNRYFAQSTAANRAAFANKISAYLIAHNFDGLDIDLEGPSINSDYGALVQAISSVIKPQGKLLTAAMSQGYGGGSIPSSVFQYLDFVNIMAYDAVGYWDPNTPGQHSSLAFAKSNTQYWLGRGLPKEKAVLGVPFYGYSFGTDFRSRDYPYNDIVAKYPGAENVDQTGSTIWYNGIPTIKAKTNYAFDQGIGGIMIWSLDYDVPGAKSLLTAINDVFNARTSVTPVDQAPYTGVIVSIPGKIEAENYDLGGQGLAYNDLTTANEGGAYRTDAVDVQACTDATAGYNVGYISDGEWMEYTVNVTDTRAYNINFRTASTGVGVIRMEIDGVDVTGAVSLPATAGWQTWATTTKTNVNLVVGKHVVRLFAVTGGFNLNYVTVTVPNTTGPGYLHASGKNIINSNGNFLIKAANTGNFMVQEGYMLNLGGGFQYNFKNKIADIVGVANRDQFYDDYLNNYITKRDIDSLAKFGFNAIRLPMHYNLFTPLGQPDVYLEKGFALVDNIISWCRANKMYVILDLHAAPGGQSSGDISDYIAGQPSLWESSANRDQTVKLWKRFAQRYANEEYVGGYDLINETNWTLANNNALLAQIMKDITTAIRTVDNNHILFIEGNSYANDYNGLTPKWDNNMAYSFHKYWNDNTDASLNFIFGIRDGQNVPIWLGEFGENSNHWIAESIALMNKNNIGWAIWPYKKMGSVSGICSFKEPANWQAVASYINGGAKPTAIVGQAALDEMIQNIKVENCTMNKGYLYALLGEASINKTIPYGNINALIPGRIAASKYDEGKRGYAYNDAVFQTTQFGSGGGSYTAWNTGWYGRNDGVDLEYSTAEATTTVGYTETGEWMQYTITVASTGTYLVKVRVASGTGGNMTLSSDGTNLFTNVAIAATGAWTTWQTVTLGNVNLTAGTHKLRLTVSTAGYNINYIDFAPVTITQSPYNGTAAPIPGKIEAENYDFGIQGQSYSDATVTNEGGAYRNDGVDIQTCTDAGTGYNLSYIAATEWTEYAVNVTTAGNYDIEARVATTATGKSFHIEMDGVNVSGTISLPNTGGWQAWQTVTISNISLTAGNKLMRIVMDTDGFNLNYVNYKSTITTGLENDISNDLVTLYPNPASHTLILSSSGYNSYKITSITGVTVNQGQIGTTNEISVEHLQTGTYILEVVGIDKTKVFYFIKY